MTARLAGAVLLAALGFGPAHAQDFRQGLAAYNAADFATAIANWRPLAERGDPDSQTALAFLYYKGLGVAQDGAVAVGWYARAAERGQPDAQLFLGWSYLDGIGIARDAVQSYKWCDLAYSNGAADSALYCRDAAAQRLTADQLRESNRQVVEWFARRRRPAP